jgi:murein DD-endopeptidase MepM/ murein hydrolase activator NlpD
MPLPPPLRHGRVLLVAIALVILAGWPIDSARTTSAPRTLLPDRYAGTAATVSAPAAGDGTRFRPPLDGPPDVTRQFEGPANPYGPGHRGIDLAAAPGTPVVAAADGTVSYAGPVAGRGVVTVTHGDLRTTYEPVTPVVRAGQHVTAGQPLALLRPGHVGCPVAACLHWGLLRGSVYLDPLSVLWLVAPRLLPLGQGPSG